MAVAAKLSTEWPLSGVLVVPSETTVLFVHGYNNAHAEARYKYAIFRDLIHGLGVTTPVIEIHWPGNKAWGFLSFACYPLEIKAAIESGQRLAAWIETLSATARLVVVTHSMGGKVVLEALNSLPNTGGASRIIGVCMMAAAVRVAKIADGTLGPQVNERLNWRVLFSESDKVLHLRSQSGRPPAWTDSFRLLSVGTETLPPSGSISRRQDMTTVTTGSGGKPDKKDSDTSTQPLAAPLFDTAPTGSGDGISAQNIAEFLGFAPAHMLPTSVAPVEHALPIYSTPTDEIGNYQYGA